MIKFDENDVKRVELPITEVDPEALEEFFLRNNIPFCVRSICDGKRIYLVRDGIDYIDSGIYALKRWGDLNDPKVINKINMMVLKHNFQEIIYEYECYGCNRTQEDEAILHMFIG